MAKDSMLFLKVGTGLTAALPLVFSLVSRPCDTEEKQGGPLPATPRPDFLPPAQEGVLFPRRRGEWP